MSENSNLLQGMTQALDTLKARHMQLANTQGQSTWGNIAVIIGTGGLVTRTPDVDPTGIKASIQQILDTSQQSINLLDGTDATAANYGNLFDAALTDESAFSLWSDLAQNTGADLARALGLVDKWDIKGFIGTVATNFGNVVKEAAPDKTSLFAGAGIIVVILILILVIKLS